MFSRLFSNQKKDAVKRNSPKRHSTDGFQSVPRLHLQMESLTQGTVHITYTIVYALLPKLESKHIRVVIFKDHEKRASKSLLFDSNGILACISGQSDEGSFNKGNRVVRHGSGVNEAASPLKVQEHFKPRSDVAMLGEMIFGSASMAYKGCVTKVHLTRSPPQLLFTKLFALRSRSAGVNFCDGEGFGCSSGESMPRKNSSLDSISVSSKGSCQDGILRSYSSPMRVPASMSSHNYLRPKACASMTSLDSIPFSASQSSQASNPSPSGSLIRRWHRSQVTSLDAVHLWKFNSEASEELSAAHKLQPKIGIGVVFNLWDGNEQTSGRARMLRIRIAASKRMMENFFFTHYALLDAHLQTMRVKVERAIYLKKDFITAAINAFESFQADVISLYLSPRISEPVWLNLMVATEIQYHELIGKFFSSFISLVYACETKETNYFLSTLLTAVLTYHVSWVATVMPPGSRPMQRYLEKHSSKTVDAEFLLWAVCAFNLLNPLSNSMKLAGCLRKVPSLQPTLGAVGLKGANGLRIAVAFDALVAPRKRGDICYRCAYAGDMYGCVGYPLRLARTVIVGENAALVCELLYVLSYFIRCSEVKENTDDHVSGDHGFSGCSWGDSTTTQSPLSPSTPNSVQGWVEQAAINDPKPLHSRSWMEKVCSDRDITGVDCQSPAMTSETVDNSSVLKSCTSSFEAKACVKDSRNSTIVRSSAVVTSTSHLKRPGCKRTQANLATGSCTVVDSDRPEESRDLLNFSAECLCSLQNNSEYVEYCIDCRKLRDAGELRSPTRFCRHEGVEPAALNKADNISLTSAKNIWDDPGIPCMCSSSFRCYCCHQIENKFTNVVHSQAGETSVASLSNSLGLKTDLTAPSRVRKASDPIDCLSIKDRGSLARSSKNSNDSGTEMSGASCDAASGVTCDCDQDGSDSMDLPDDTNIQEVKCSDFDSDYSSLENGGVECTVENDGLMLTKSSSTMTLQSNLPSEAVLDPQTILDEELARLNFICLPLRRPTPDEPQRTQQKHVLEFLPEEVRTFGRSLLAGYCDHYVPDFVLHGTKQIDRAKLAMDLQASVKHSVLDEQISEAVCIVANTDTWTCELWTLARRQDSLMQATSECLETKQAAASELVSSMVEVTKELFALKMPAYFCLLHMEELLKDIYNRSLVLNEYLRATQPAKMCPQELFRLFGYHASDIDVLASVAATLSPLPWEASLDVV